jgi:hypothetical protein
VIDPRAAWHRRALPWSRFAAVLPIRSTKGLRSPASMPECAGACATVGDHRVAMQNFQCNVCGVATSAPIAAIREREAPSCANCGSNLRFRTIINGLSEALFGCQITLPAFPVRKDLRGIGLSDANTYALRLADHLDYENTFFHQEPRVDVGDIEACPYRDLDFVIASEVFEHVCPPVSRAFVNARTMLRDGGAMVFSVPWIPSGTTSEHFPDLFDFRIVKESGRYTLHNTTREGVAQRFSELIFHGGPGSTLEMRLFAYDDLVRHFAGAGFSEPIVLRREVPRFGIDWTDTYCSIPMVVRAR